MLLASPYLAQASPDLGLDGRVHLLLIDSHCDELVQDGGDTQALGIVVVFAEADQVEQPGSHVLQTEVFQLDTCIQNEQAQETSVLISSTITAADLEVCF